SHMEYAVSLFFISSSRRHTRFSRDWSSDVCSSDLAEVPAPHRLPELLAAHTAQHLRVVHADVAHLPLLGVPRDPAETLDVRQLKIGRASCRERTATAGNAGPVKEKPKRMPWQTRKR